MKINANFRLFAATNFDSTKYIASPAYGVNRFMLDRIGDEKARATTIVEYKPNSKFPKHTHIGGEEFLVLKGTFKDEYGAFGEGTYVRNPVDSQHAPWVDEDGCTIFVKLLQMAGNNNNNNNETKPLHINLNQAKTDKGKSTNYGTVAELYSNTQTGETVEMCWLDAHKVLEMDEKSAGGEELFVMEGSLIMVVDAPSTKADDETTTTTSYQKWGWLRFPASSSSSSKKDDEPQQQQLIRRPTVKAGPEGAQVFRKTGHLTDKALAMEKIQINPVDETVVGL